MNKRIRKKKMKQYAKQHGITLGNVPTKLLMELPPIPPDHPNAYILSYMGTIIPPKPTLYIDHL